MTLLSPWWLLLLPVLYVVIILHTLHPERHSVVVPSTLLWQRVLKELAADAPWRRIVANLLLLMQLAALAGLILALACPALLLPAWRQRHDIVLIDTSASMSATDLKPNRLEAAKQLLIDKIKVLRPRRLTLIDAGPRPTILYSGPGSVLASKNALGRAKPTDGTNDWARTGVLARSVASPGSQVLIVTDGAIDTETLEPLLASLEETPIRLIQAAGSGHNVGITAFDARQTGATMAAYEVLVSLHNFSPTPVETTLVVRGKQGEIARHAVALPASGSRRVVFPFTFSTQDTLEAEILVSDALATDNKAHLTAYPPTPTRVLLVGPGNYFLERGLRVFPQVRLERRLLYPEGGDYPLVIFDRMPIPDSFRGTALYLAGTPEDRARGMRSSPEITWWHRTHPLTRFVNWLDLGIHQSLIMPRQEGGQVLVESEAGPLLQLVTGEKSRILTLGLSLEESDWPLKVAFPVFLSQLLQWAHPEGWQFVRSPVVPGESVEMPRALGSENGWRVRLPSGAIVRVPPKEGALFDQTLSAGLYTVLSEMGEFSFAANSGSPAESNLAPRLHIPHDGGAEGAGTGARLPAEVWRPIVLLAFMLLLAEGWLYTHKVRRPVNLALPGWRALLRRVRG